jgi:hypothetical protein
MEAAAMILRMGKAAGEDSDEVLVVSDRYVESAGRSR